MVKNHLKRLNAPKSWPITRKKTIWIMRPNPGAHSLKSGIPLTIALRDLLKQAKTAREVKYIANNKDVLVDTKVRTDIAYITGFMDVISLPKIKENYRLLLTKKGKIDALKIDDKEANLKLCKILGKSLIKGKTQLNMHDGRNILTEKNDYKVGDSVLIEIKDQKIVNHVKFEKGTMIYLTGGKHISLTGTIESIENNKIIFKAEDNSVYETLKKFAFGIGTDKSLIQLK